MRESIPLFRSYIKAAQKLDGDKFKEFILMIADYGFDDVEPGTEDIMLEALFEAIRPNLDSSKKVSEERSEAGRKSGEARRNKTEQNRTKMNKTEQNGTNANEIEGERERERELELEQEQEREREKGDARGKRFSPPSLPEVQAYCKERQNSVDPERFIDFYAAKGWKVGNQPMKDWRACVRTWERRDNDKIDRSTRPPNRNGVIFAASMKDYNFIPWKGEEETDGDTVIANI